MQKLELTWIGKNEQPEVEPRILLHEPSKDYGDPNTENMLIHGDNLLALKALEQEYAGKVKCIYIDPPYNTGAAFEHYDDNLEHSIWLGLMRDRLQILKNLLKDDGLIFVQIGFDEMAYLKVLMDEIFIRNNCLGQIAVRMSHSAGMKRKASDKRMIKNTEYILCYYKSVAPKINPIYEECNEYPVNYYQWITKFPDSTIKIGEYCPLKDIMYPKFIDLYKLYNLKNNNESIGFLFSNSENVRKFIMENKNRIVRKDSNVPSIDIDNINLSDNQFIEYHSSQNDTYYIGVNSSGNYYQIYSLADKVKFIDCVDETGKVQKKETITNLVGDWWDGFYKDMSRVDIEGNVKMKASKKPERLIKWILECCTKPGDLVLDSFLGSGTTVAVAQKMGRKWIGIELGDHCYSLSKVRLDKVICGNDDTGISQLVNWRGGGGYKFYELAPTLIVKDKYGNSVFSDKYNPTMLAAAVAKINGFVYSPSAEVYWKQGYSQDNSFIYVTTQYLDSKMLDSIADDIDPFENLLVCAPAFDNGLSKRYDNINVRKIPRSVLEKCEFGVDNYDLNIVNPPEIDEDEWGDEEC